MPELPEVNTFQKYFDASALHVRIAGVTVHDDKIIRNMDGPSFADKLSGRSFAGSYRHGKYLFGDLDNGHSVLLHFGMTGDLAYYHAQEDRPRHERFVFHFDDGGHLGFDCPRKFARILYLEDRSAYIRELGLGPDALLIEEEAFLRAASGKSTNLKAFLLNQTNVAGIGNLYADEICYRARIHPGSRIAALQPGHLKLIYGRMKEILELAVSREPHYKNYPENWFWHWRREGHPAPSGRGQVQKTKIAGRTTYFCTIWQKEYT